MRAQASPINMAASGIKPAKGVPVVHNEGDWICADKDCENINFSWRTSCNKCSKDKGKVDIINKTGSEIGKQAAARSGGLFAAEDWQCSVCGNVNWARRSECNVCRTAKFNITEARTGAGGGYNERDGVEYNERVESDDEYDEFGRKKKKFRGKADRNGSKHKTTITYDLEKSRSEELDLSKYPLASSSTGATEEEEEEEEEDDEEDISKYDLMAELDEDTTTKPGSTKTTSIQRKSRSPSPRHSRHVSSRSQSSRSRSRSPSSRTRDTGRKRSARSRSSSPRQRRRSRSHSRSRNRKRSRSRSRSLSPHQRKPQSHSRKSRSNSWSRSHSRDRRKSYRSRSRSRSHSREQDYYR